MQQFHLSKYRMASQRFNFQASCFRLKIYYTVILLGMVTFAQSQNPANKEKIIPPKTEHPIII